ncbi:hypothetical protein [Vagococcus fessus]|uniref:Uncharacterized protein n=1 Tax=Vagococcus fessus TaxID=120370 RepID=A0A430A4M1_9ENTE|nr:hypothetical protein [Vagococcus fessus]RSU01652.1 hypothetical protein CBF31_10530 [Vagococcus fessus]
MSLNYIYIHLDTISNSLFSRGLNIHDFSSSVFDIPENILLLDPHENDGEYEPHTGLRVIRGQNQVLRYFFQKSKQRESEVKWIDFKDINLIQQLTPMEIAELLYFGHMSSQLHSPFFYKLQNNFVYFEKPDDLTKVFYRRMDDFYKIISAKLENIVFDKINHKKGLFKKPVTVSKIEFEKVKVLKTAFQEGLVLDVRQAGTKEEDYIIPLYVVEDRIRNISDRDLREENRVGQIVYSTSSMLWTIEVTDTWLIQGISKV